MKESEDRVGMAIGEARRMFTPWWKHQ